MGRVLYNKDNIEEARALYIATNMSIAQVAEATNINVNVLKKYSYEERWNIYKKDGTDSIAFTEELMEELSDSMAFYKMLKEDLIKEYKEQDGIKDKRTALDMFLIAEKRRLQLLMVEALDK